jgi:hypothetical protein
VPHQGVQRHVSSHTLLLCAPLRISHSFRYVNFGVFALYNDPCLVESLKAGLCLITLSPVSEMISFPKLSKTLFAFIHTLCTSEFPLFLSADSPSSTPLFCSPHTSHHNAGLRVLRVHSSRHSGRSGRTIWSIQTRRLGHWCVHRLRQRSRRPLELATSGHSARSGCDARPSLPSFVSAQYFVGVVAAFNAHTAANPK